MNEPLWYVVHTYSGYENKVKANIEKIVENRGLEEEILEVVVPVQDAVEIKNGKKKTVSRKVFPGYVLLRMIMNDDTWFVVRNTRGVTSFVGPGSRPVPLTEEEAKAMGIGVDSSITEVDLQIGDNVQVVFGAFEGSIGVVKEILISRNVVLANFSVFGRETSVELDFEQVVKV